MSVSDVLTGIQNSTAKTNAEKAQSRMGQSTLDSDSFMQLMMAQLKYQDPMNPMDNSQMLSQQAALTQVSELQKLNQNNTFMQASTFIGKNVSFTDPYNQDFTIVGSVTEVQVDSKGINLTVTGIVKDAEGKVMKDKDGKDAIVTEKYAMKDVMKNSGNISIANPYVAPKAEENNTSTPETTNSST